MSYRVFTRTWWKDNPEWPNGLEPCIETCDLTEEEERAVKMCEDAIAKAEGRMNMEPYSIEWKMEQQKKNGGWPQKKGDIWEWHYIEYDTEYHKGCYFTKSEAIKENKKGE